MSEELKSCPACGGEGVINIVGHGVNLYQVRCKKCSQCGPIEATANNAETRWNALPRALVWSTEPPKVGGFYWARRKNTNTLHVVRVMEIREELSVFMPGSEVDGYLHWYTEWAGPILEPQEPRP